MSGLSQMGRIAREVADKHGVALEAIYSRQKNKKVVYARHEAFARCYALRGPLRDSPYSLPAIGRHFDYDHTSVLFGIRSHVARSPNHSPITAIMWTSRSARSPKQAYNATSNQEAA